MSVTTAGPVVLVDGPAPERPPFNLYTVAQLAAPAVDEAGGLSLRWGNGIVVRPYPPGTGFAIEPCLEGTFAAKEEGEAIERSTFGGYTGYLPVVCSTFGLDWDEMQRRGNLVLEAVEPFIQERQLVSGEFKPDNPFLGDLNVASLGTAGPTEALALLEDAIGATARAGVIHATPSTVTAWNGASLLVQQQGQLRSLAGTPVVKGSGYIGQIPLGAGALTADQQYAWATGPILYNRESQMTPNPPTLREALDRSSNRVDYRAERILIVAWDRVLQATVLVDRSL